MSTPKLRIFNADELNDDLGYSVTVRLHDVVLEEEFVGLVKEPIGYFIFCGDNLHEVLVIPEKGPSNPVKIPLSKQITQEMIRIVAKTLGPDEKIIGSISIPQHIILNGGLSNYT